VLAAHDVPGWDVVVAGPVRRRSGTAPTGAARLVVGPTAMVLGSPVTDDGLDPNEARGGRRLRAGRRGRRVVAGVGRGGPLPGPVELVIVDDDSAVAGWGGQWRMPSPAGGTEPARQAEESAGSRATVADATAEATPPDP
jgi:hypothetical protein